MAPAGLHGGTTAPIYHITLHAHAHLTPQNPHPTQQHPPPQLHQQVCSCNGRLSWRLHCHHLFAYLSGGGTPPAGHTQRNQANTTTGGLWQSLTSEIRPTSIPGGAQCLDQHIIGSSMGVEPTHRFGVLLPTLPAALQERHSGCESSCCGSCCCTAHTSSDHCMSLQGINTACCR
jgi:hypothetical protein